MTLGHRPNMKLKNLKEYWQMFFFFFKQSQLTDILYYTALKCIPDITVNVEVHCVVQCNREREYSGRGEA